MWSRGCGTMSEGLSQEWDLWLTGLWECSSQTSFRIPFGMDQFLFLFLSSFLTVFLEHLQKNLRIPLLTVRSALPSDMAAFHQQSRGEELKGVSLSENTDVITDHDHCSQAQPEVCNQQPESWTPAFSLTTFWIRLMWVFEYFWEIVCCQYIDCSKNLAWYKIIGIHRAIS